MTDATAQIALHDSPALDAIAARVVEMLADAGHDTTVRQAILAHALVDLASSPNFAILMVRSAHHRHLGHRVGAKMLAEHPEKAERYADDAHERARRTTSLPRAALEGAIEAVLRRWVSP